MPVEFLAELSGLRFEPRPVWAEPDELISADLLLAAQKANRAVIVALDGCASAEASIRKLQRRLSALVVADIQSGLAGSGGVVGMDAKLREPAFGISAGRRFCVATGQSSGFQASQPVAGKPSFRVFAGDCCRQGTYLPGAQRHLALARSR